MIYLLGVYLPAAFVLLLTPFAIRLAERAGMMDRPGGRHVHKMPTPRAGGLVLFPVVLVALTTCWWGTVVFWYLALALVSVLFVGLWDDWKGAHYSTKFFAQTTAALVVVAAGVKVHILPWDMANTLLTVVWIVGITNAVNLIDGLDGLAAGLAFNALLSIGILAAVSGGAPVAYFCLILAGGVLGFLRWNLPPARAFLGDSGSLLLGFSIAVMSIIRSSKTATFLVLAVPVLFVTIPMADTVLAFVRRMLNGSHPFKPDKEHLHHLLLELSFSPNQVLGYFYTFSATLGILSFLFAQTGSTTVLAVSLVTAAVMVVMVRWMRILNLRRAVSQLNRFMTRIYRRMRGAEETEGRIIMLRSLMPLLVVFDLGVVWIAGRDWMMAAMVVLAAVLTLMDIIRFRVTGREQAFPWISLGGILLAFLGQYALVLGPGRSDTLDDNRLVMLVLLVLVAAAGVYLMVRRRWEGFIIHPLAILAFYACILFSGLGMHLAGVQRMFPYVLVMGNTVVIYISLLAFSRRVLLKSVAVNLLGFLGVLVVSATPWLS